MRWTKRKNVTAVNGTSLPLGYHQQKWQLGLRTQSVTRRKLVTFLFFPSCTLCSVRTPGQRVHRSLCFSYRPNAPDEQEGPVYPLGSQDTQHQGQDQRYLSAPSGSAAPKLCDLEKTTYSPLQMGVPLYLSHRMAVRIR